MVVNSIRLVPGCRVFGSHRPLVKNLFLGYFHAPKSKRSDVLKVMAGLLNLTPDEIAQV